jgi:superfamily II DNA or RNA helicase
MSSKRDNRSNETIAKKLVLGVPERPWSILTASGYNQEHHENQRRMNMIRPHQIEAIKDVISGFQTFSRGQLVMPCATGKTWTCMWVKEKLKAKRTLVLVPSLNLLSQILNDWNSAARDQFDALCVCSDETVTTGDAAVTRVADLSLPFPVSNKASVIADFLRKNNDQVIFSTYQSSPKIAQAQKKAGVPYFDLVIADEAHRCAGKVDSAFATVLNGKLIKSHRRLFATATPRVYTRSVKRTAEVHGVEVVDMSDEKIFGPRFHTLTFSKAIKDELLTDYRVVIVGVDKNRIRQIKNWIEREQLIETDAGLLTDAKTLAVSIAVLKAIKDWNLHRIISFHGRVRRARDFSEDIQKVAQWLPDADKIQGKLRADYVSGKMSTELRNLKLKRLKNIGAQIGLLSNARCLSEGIDVPALDGVVFVDPKGSEIDIIQSVGRAIRLKVGIIILPVFIEQTDDAEEALESSEFRPIWDVLEALKSHDDRLCLLDQLRIDQGAKRKRIEASDLTHVQFDLPTSVDENFAQLFRTHLVEKTTESWMFWYGLLQAFVNENGDCRVPARYETSDGYRLGQWVNNQRVRKDKIDPDRQQHLEALSGWSWDVPSDRWDEGFFYLKEFTEREGHSRVPRLYKTDDGYRLGSWVITQRQGKDKTKLDRQQRLEALPGWSWNTLNDRWDEGFSYLKEFIEREGHSQVSARYKTKDGYRLGQWVGIQRANKDAMDLVRRQRLEALPGWCWSWDVNSEKWEQGFSHLKELTDRDGHCRVLQPYKTKDGYRLGSWVRNQRATKDKMDLDRRQRLEALQGWSWDVRSEKWEEGFSYLKQFSEREAHCRVLQGYKTDDGYRLGQWVAVQRRNIDMMEPERRQRLEATTGLVLGHSLRSMGGKLLSSEAVLGARGTLRSVSTL